MSYNPRASMAPSNPSNQRHRQQEEDAFMKLPDHEIASCISDIGIAFSTLDLQKPNPQQIQKIFEWFAELLMNVNREIVAPAMHAAAEDLVGGDAERLFTADTRDLMGFFVMMRRLLEECGIRDFTFQDLYKPTRERMVKIFSYIINFIRFRESQTAVIDQHFDKAERTKMRIEQLYNDKQAKEQHLEDLKRNAQATQIALEKKNQRNAELKQRLLELKKAQERVVQQFDEAKRKQQSLKELLESKTEQTLLTKQEAEKLRPYTQESPAVLETALRDLNNSLSADRTQIETFDRRARALQTSTDSFITVAQDVNACTKLLHEVQTDLQREEEELTRASRRREALSERTNNVRDVEHQEKLLQRQLLAYQARTDKLHKSADEKSEQAKEKMEELKRIHDRLKEERGEKGREMEKRRVRIEQTEKKMADLKENLENEVDGARGEYVKMESHIRLYITEMEAQIA